MNDEVYLYRAHAGFEAARSLPDVPLHGHSFKVVASSVEADIHARLTDALKEYNYTYLNDLTSASSDLNVALRLAESLPKLNTLHLQSAPDRGVYIDSESFSGQNAMVWLSSRFEAAHFLPNVHKGHKCGRLHGHGFGVRLHANARVAMADLEAKWLSVKATLDNVLLNDVEGLSNPTSEHLAQWIWHALSMPELVQVTVQETRSAGCSFNGEHHRIWKQQNAESALYIPSQTQPTGHSYILRLHLTAALDPVMGWAVDYSDVKSLFKPIYDLIDHHDLNTTLGVAQGEVLSSLHLARWIRAELSPVLPQLSGVDVFESDTESVSLEWLSPSERRHIPLYLA